MNTNNVTSETNVEKLTNFEKVKEFNEAFNVKKFDKFSKDKSVFDTHKDVVDLSFSLIKEEFEELQQAINDKDMDEVRDALSDLLYVVYGMQYKLCVNADEDFNIVHESNMSKLCSSEEEALKTIEWYKGEFEKGNKPYKETYYEKLPNTNKWAVRNKADGKVLKSIYYTPVSWT
jgi:NTP pyrophosphatase (non-canonical NTP hydrolase)